MASGNVTGYNPQIDDGTKGYVRFKDGKVMREQHLHEAGPADTLLQSLSEAVRAAANFKSCDAPLYEEPKRPFTQDREVMSPEELIKMQ